MFFKMMTEKRDFVASSWCIFLESIAERMICLSNMCIYICSSQSCPRLRLFACLKFDFYMYVSKTECTEMKLYFSPVCVRIFLKTMAHRMQILAAIMGMYVMCHTYDSQNGGREIMMCSLWICVCMYVYVCMYVCMYVCVCMCVYV